VTGLGDAFGALTAGEFTTFGLANGALDRGESAGCGIVATHADKTKGSVTMIAPLTTVLIMDSPGFIVVTLTAWFFTQNTCLPAALHPGSGCLFRRYSVALLRRLPAPFTAAARAKACAKS
jgi:hypothetical protein